MDRLKIIAAWGGLLALLMTALWLATATDLAEIEELESSLLQTQTLLHRLEQLPEREESIREALEILNDGLTDRSLYHGDPSSVRTEVQRDVRAVASNQGIRIASMRPLGPRSGNDNKITASVIQLNYQASSEENINFLKELETMEPMLRVQRMSVSVQTASTPSRPALLSVSLDVAGYVVGQER